MKLNRVHDLKGQDGHMIPAYLIEPDQPEGGLVLIHGYTDAKDDILGFAVHLAEAGVAVLVPDLPGHGGNMAPVGRAVLDDFEQAIAYMRRYGKVIAAGHSIGGRLSMMTSADAMLALSPSVVAEISPMGKFMFEQLPTPSIREPYSGYVADLLNELGDVPTHDKPCLLLYSARDIPNIIAGTKALAARLPRAQLHEISRNVRPDLQPEQPPLARFLPRWYNHIELKTNAEVLEVAPAWVRSIIKEL
ncbi:MAG: hypothetical protein A2Z04_06535 [Chloroflexi bacterium RBG_16_57_9]|nr:MAG: hypothetical protein A2Z04_06535 [Chloroflexi bacterium RBG_16_57_9]